MSRPLVVLMLTALTLVAQRPAPLPPDEATLVGEHQDEMVRVLIIDGQNNHDWEGTTKALRAILETTGRFKVSVSTTPSRKGAKSDWHEWRPSFKDHHVVAVNYNGQPWPARVNKAFMEFIHGGGGAVNVHASNNAFSNWKDWNRLIALGWRGANFGERVTVNDKTGAQIRTPKGEGPGAGHGPRHAFLVTVRDKAHPIMRGLPTWWKHAEDELYHGQRGPGADMQILSSAFSDRKKGGTGAHEPITWVVPHGKGNVVTTVLGHHWSGQKDFASLYCVGFQTVFARACEWAGTGKVTLSKPGGFPNSETTSVVEPKNVKWGVTDG